MKDEIEFGKAILAIWVSYEKALKNEANFITISDSQEPDVGLKSFELIERIERKEVD